MAAAIVLPVSGPYTGGWNSFGLGVNNDDGFVLTGQWTGQEVNQTDLYGMTLVEAIYRGINWRLRFRTMEWSFPGFLAAMQAFGSTGAPSTTFTPKLDNVGDRYSKFSHPLVLTAFLAKPPVFLQTLTALSAIMAPNSNTEAMLTSKVCEGPLEMVLLPYTATVGSLVAQDVAFTTT